MIALICLRKSLICSNCSFISGANGIEGGDVPENNDVEELTALGCKCGNVTTVREGSEYSVEHKFCGSPAIQGSDAGDGGCGGPGGRSGEIKLFGLMSQSNVFVFHQNGMGKFHFSFITSRNDGLCWSKMYLYCNR